MNIQGSPARSYGTVRTHSPFSQDRVYMQLATSNYSIIHEVNYYHPTGSCSSSTTTSVHCVSCRLANGSHVREAKAVSGLARRRPDGGGRADQLITCLLSTTLFVPIGQAGGNTLDNPTNFHAPYSKTYNEALRSHTRRRGGWVVLRCFSSRPLGSHFVYTSETNYLSCAVNLN